MPEWVISPLTSMLDSVGTGVRAALADDRVWVAILVALVFGGGLALVGFAVSRMLGLLDDDAPFGEQCGVGLGCGLAIFAAVWATVISVGRTAFAPVALGFALAIALGFAIPRSRPRSAEATTSRKGGLRRSIRTLAVPIVIGAVMVAALGLLFGATMAPSPLGGVQPVEFMDEAFYSILGRDLARTGVETVYSPSGFDVIPGLPSQTWYHWGELWLSASVITLFGLEPTFARHYVVLPLLLLAAATLTGTLVRHLAGTASRAAFLFGATASLVLAPVPLPGPYFAAWARGLMFGITLYGLAAVVVLLGLYVVTVWGQRHRSRALSIFCGALGAAILPSHIVIAFLAAIGIAGVLLISNVDALVRRRSLAPIHMEWRWMLGAAAVLALATILWGAVTGHGIGASGIAEAVMPFSASWQESLVLTLLGAGLMWLIPASWWLARTPIHRAMVVGAGFSLVGGALFWGARLGDFNTFHAFYGGIALFATPVAAVAGWLVIRRLRRRLFPVAGVVMLAFVVQFAIGSIAVVGRLQRFGPGAYDPIPLALLEEVERLPPDAKIAYACRPLEEIGAVWDARLLSIDANTGRRIIPMCFQAEYLSHLHGVANPNHVISPLFELAPQRVLFTHAGAKPDPAAVTDFMRLHGIRYIYADSAHPNTLVPEALQIAAYGQFLLLRIP